MPVLLRAWAIHRPLFAAAPLSLNMAAAVNELDATRRSLAQRGQLFDEALAAVGDTNHKRFNSLVAEAIGYSPSGERHVREYRDGSRPLTLPKVLQLCVNRPAAGRALLTRLIAWAMPEDERRPVILAVQELLVCTLDLARLIAEVAADGAVDNEEGVRLDAAIAKTRKAMDRVVSALARPESRPS